MNFKEWSNKYYPDESDDVLHKLSHAWAAGHVHMACSEADKNLDDPPNKEVATEALILNGLQGR